MNMLLSRLKRKPFLNSFIGLLTLFLMFTSAERAHADCKVKNENTGVVYHDLQTAINAASSGDTLLVKGKCETSVGFTIVDKSLTIKGEGRSRSLRRSALGKATLDGNDAATVLTITESATDTVFVKLENLRIENGNGGPGGGINNNATLTLIHTEVVDNHAFSGGGIFNSVFTIDDVPSAGSVTLIHSTVSHNTADFGGGGITSLGGIEQRAIINVQESKIHHNSAVGNGGGISAINTNLFVTQSKISHNKGGSGGGLFNEASLAILKHTKIRSNTATDRGGGIVNLGEGIPGGEATLVLESSTLRNNFAGFEGGGLYNETAEANLIDSLVRRNTATNGGGIFNTAGSTLNLADTLVIDNIPNEVVDL